MSLSQALTTCGLLLDLVGGILLAVEAIRLPNLLRLRNEVLPRVRVFFESPSVFDEPASVKERRANSIRGFGGRPGLYVGFHYLAVAAALLGLEGLRLFVGVGPRAFFPVAAWQWAAGGWRRAGLIVVTLAVWALLSFTLGCWVHRSVERVTEVFVAVLIKVEEGTPSGATGIAGALFFAAGFLLQLIGVWV